MLNGMWLARCAEASSRDDKSTRIALVTREMIDLKMVRGGVAVCMWVCT